MIEQLFINALAAEGMTIGTTKFPPPEPPFQEPGKNQTRRVYREFPDIEYYQSTSLDYDDMSVFTFRRPEDRSVGNILATVSFTDELIDVYTMRPITPQNRAPSGPASIRRNKTFNYQDPTFVDFTEIIRIVKDAIK